MVSTSGIIRKIRHRGLRWFISRVLDESQRGANPLFRVAKPFVNLLHRAVLRPLTTRKRITGIFENSLVLVYDLEVSPITFNFVWALALAEHERRKNHLVDLQVVFVPGKHNGLREEDPEYEKMIGEPNRHWRKNELLFNLCNLLPSCKGITFCASRSEAKNLLAGCNQNLYPHGYTVDFPISYQTYPALKSGFNLAYLCAPIQALNYIEQWLSHRNHGRKVITITLRQSSYMPRRNSNVKAWAEFARSLNPKKYFVVFVPDTDSALDPIPTELQDFEYFIAPCWNVQLRMALYEKSYMNLGINNGPMGLCWLNANCRYATFKMLVPEVPQATLKALKYHGFTPNESLPFAGKNQQWIWQDDSVEIIKAIFSQIEDHCAVTQ